MTNKLKKKTQNLLYPIHCFSICAVLIVTSPLNSHETLKLLTQLSGYHRSKVLIIDTVGNIFNNQHEFYQTINQPNDEWLPSNLLVLTMLTTKLKRFLNATYSTEFHNIYGNTMDDELIQPTFHSAIEPNVTSNESFIINLLMKRIIGIGQMEADDAAAAAAVNDNSDDNVLVHFNKTELNLIATVFEKLWFNDSSSCRRSSMASAASDDANEAEIAVAATQTTKIKTESVPPAVTQNVYNQSNEMGKFVNESLSMCAPNNNSLSKCETFLRERASSTFFANSTRTLDIMKVFCKQIQLWWQKNTVQPQSNQRAAQQRHHKSNENVPKILNRKVSRLGENLTTAPTTAAANTTLDRNTSDTNAKQIAANTSDEFVNLIPNQVDATFGEYFPFLDFIVAKLALSHNLTVNYNNQSSGANGGGSFEANTAPAPNATPSTAGEIFDFCVLELRVKQMTTGAATAAGAAGRSDTTTITNIANYTDDMPLLNGTHIPTIKFVWRPILILQQNELHQNIFVTHPLLSIGYHSWFFDNTHKFWTCGLLCWILAGIVVLLLICIFVASITFGLAIR